ncbi:hypothetical protein K7472_29660 [Streptomyces sp. PTM05]|uniref:DUF6924 domain-containing protein n=1 Tax=Streptantibioticus parmotrematis TaxID=2873249 RepID=A0ABS7R0J8_9ACTN|nr:hypothetical protein [Streptantibioticus parmotrematis]MBY8888982.1 hypothetical protein [Streptantibioticus parmotrematis]
MLLIRTHHGDDAAWRDVLSRMGELPGLVAPRSGRDAHAVPRGPIPRRLIVVDDRAWQGATAEKVREALNEDGTWIPDLVLLADDRTTAGPHLRPLLAFRGTEGDAFRITPRQAALTYLVLHRPYQKTTLERFEEEAPAEPDGESGEEWENGLPDPVGACLESLNPPPRYEPPTRALPPLTQETFGLLVRTDFTDDAAWTSLLDTVHRPGPGYDDPIEDFTDDVDAVDDPAFEGSSPEQLMALVRDNQDPGQVTADLVMIADGTTMRDPDRHVLVVPLAGPIGHAFRIIPERVGIMVCNLAIGNMGIEAFMDD